MFNTSKTSDYVVIASLFSNKELTILVAYQEKSPLDNLYLLNQFPYQKDNLKTFKMLFDIFSSPNKPKEFVNFFVEENMYYAVFKYHGGENIKQKYRKGFSAQSFEERCTILEDILIRIDKIYNLPNPIVGCLTEPQNIKITQEKEVNFYGNLQNIEIYNNSTGKDLILKNIRDIIFTILEPEAQAGFNKPLHIVLDKCERGVYESIPEMIVELKKAEKISKTSSWISYFKYQISLRKNLIAKLSKISLSALVVAGIFYLAYSKLTEGQQAGSAPVLVSIGDVTYNGNVSDESDKNVSTENIDNQTGEASGTDITLSEGLDMEYEDYIVQYGDTVSSISTNYYKDSKYITAVATFNGIDVSEKLTPGTILKLPNRTAIALYISR